MTSRPVRIVIADDSRPFCEQLQEFFSQQQDIEVCGVAANGLEALEMVKQRSPDVLVLDMIMPYLDGLGVLEKMAASNSATPKVLMLTALGLETVISRAAQLGASYYIMKPIDFSILAGHIRRLAAEIPRSKYTKPAGPDLFAVVTNILTETGMPVSLKGYHYLRDAVMMAVDEPGWFGAINQEIYPRVAGKHKTTRGRLERAMRYAIGLAWNSESMAGFFGDTAYAENRRPTAAEFIAMVAEKARGRATG